MLILGYGVASGQETDDMYFRSKDRTKLKATPTESYSSNFETFKKKNFPEAEAEDAEVYGTNPADSYSAREINPEFVARSQSETTATGEQAYFEEGYAPANPTDSYSASVVNPNLQNNSPSFTNSWYGPSYSPMFNPYRGFYDPWMSPYYGGYYNPWMNPYGSGWNTSLNYIWSPWGSGWNVGIGYTWGNVWCPVNSYWGSPFYYPTIIAYPVETTRPNYGKRPSRNSALAGDVRPRYTTPRENSARDVNRENGRKREEYYVRPGRRMAAVDNSSADTNENNSFRPNRSRFEDTGFNTSPSRTRTDSFRESRSSTFSSPSFNSGNGSRSRTSSSSSSGSRSRGRD
jgi:hypothetical protein